MSPHPIVSARGAATTPIIDTAELAALDAWWRAANYLAVGPAGRGHRRGR